MNRDLKSKIFFYLLKELLGDLNVLKAAYKGLGYAQTGTSYYVSPEVWRHEHYDTKSDIWSSACISYEILTFHPPFRA